MFQLTDVQALQSQLDAWRQAGERIAFVPTMGNLHEGHLQLVDEARRHADRVVVSIFVNPTQFGPGEDFDSYPRSLDEDAALLEQRNTDVVFMPTVDVIYPHGEKTDEDCIPPASLTEQLCGLSRPGHFAGVATVVKHLFELVRPDIAIFGEKDYQQLQVIRWLVNAQQIPVDIIGVPTVREDNGLAMSSRNRYLTGEQRQQAGQLYACLSDICLVLQSGVEDFEALSLQAMNFLSEAGFEPDYVEIRNAADLSAPGNAEEWVVLAAAKMGKARLIDNIHCKKSK